MQRALRFGTIDVPEGWTDQTSYQFVSPPLEDKSAPMLAARQARVGQSSINVVMTSLKKEGDANGTLRVQIENLREAVPGLEVLGTAPWRHKALGELPALEIRVQAAPGMYVQQLQVFVPRAHDVVHLTFSCLATEWALARPHFQALLDSFQPS